MIFKLFRSIIKLGEKIQEEAEKELYDLQTIQQKLVELHTLYDMGEMDEETYITREEELLNRYKIAKERESSE